MSAMTIGAGDSNAAAKTVANSLTRNSPSSHAIRAGALTTGSTAPTPAASSGITSNDFLSLLVTEMKNQDPTQPTDPNAYIQQLVGVNSLQQLISINQNLSNLNPTGGSGTTPGAGGLPAIGA